MNIGELRQRVLLQKLEKKKDENGVVSTGFVDIRTVWAKVQYKKEREKERLEATDIENTTVLEILVRYETAKELTTKDRIVFCDKLYEIQKIEDLYFRNKYLKVTVMEVVKEW